MAEKNDDGGWTTLEQSYLFRSKYYSLRQDQIVLPSGEQITYTLVDHPGYALAVPVNSQGLVILERVYRHTVQETVIECPSGGLDGDPPKIAANRELEEETGWRSNRLEPLGTYYGSNGISNEVFTIFLATELEFTGSVDREPTEQIEVFQLPLSEAVELVLKGVINDGPSALGLLLAESRMAS